MYPIKTGHDDPYHALTGRSCSFIIPP